MGRRDTRGSSKSQKSGERLCDSALRQEMRPLLIRSRPLSRAPRTIYAESAWPASGSRHRPERIIETGLIFCCQNTPADLLGRCPTRGSLPRGQTERVRDKETKTRRRSKG